MKSVSKKQKVIGSQPYINPETGEIVPVQIVQIEEHDFDFHKAWLRLFISSLDTIPNKKMKLAIWIIDHLNKDNQLIMTQRRISELSGISLTTVRDTMIALQTGNPAFLLKINSGTYRVNPDVLWKGSCQSRMGVIYECCKR